MEIERDSKGRHKRVVVQLRPLEIERIVEIQNFVKNEYPGFKPYEDFKLHLTVFHFGIPEELFNELKTQNANLINYEAFYKRLIELFERMDLPSLNSKLLLKGSLLGLFSVKNLKFLPKNPTIALKLEKSKTLSILHKIIKERVDDWLVELGISNPDEFYKKSKNFRKDYVPHLTLGRVRLSQEEAKKLPQKIEPVELNFHNLEFLYVTK